MKKGLCLTGLLCIIIPGMLAQNYLKKWTLVSAVSYSHTLNNSSGYLDFTSTSDYKAYFAYGSNHGYADAHYVMTDSIFQTTIDGENILLNGIAMVSGTDGYYTSISCSSGAFNDYLGTAIGYGKPEISIKGVFLYLTSQDGTQSFTYLQDAYAILPSFKADTTLGTAPLAVQFTDISTGNITTREWDFGDGIISTETNPLHTYQNPGTYTVSLTLGNSKYSVEEVKFGYIRVLDPYEVDAKFSASPLSGTFPLEVQFNDQSIGNVQKWLWDFGDGNTDNIKNPIHTYTSEGFFTVKLIISNSQQSDSVIESDYIQVIDPDRLSADFTMDPSSGGAPLPVNFTDATLGNVVNWHWDFGDGETSIQENPDHTFTYPGNYTVQLIVSNSHFADTVQHEVVVDATWKYHTGGYINSSPAIDGSGNIYVGSENYYVYAFNPNGTLRWKYRTGKAVSSSPAIGRDGTIYIGSTDDLFYAINPDGTLKWKLNLGNDIYTSPALGNDGTVYITTQFRLFAISPEGILLWRYNIPSSDVSGIAYSPAVGRDGTIYFGNMMYLFAINPDGTLYWKKELQISNRNIVVTTDGTIYCGSWWNYVYALNPDGSEKWKYVAEDEVTSLAIGIDGTVYFGCWNGSLYALHPGGSFKWEYQAGESALLSCPAIAGDGTIYIGSQDYYLHVLNPDGTLKWKFKTGLYITSSPNISEDGVVYIGSHDRSLYAFATDNGGLAVSDWPCFQGTQNHAGNINFLHPEAPTAYFSADTTRGFYPLQVHFSDSSQGSVSSRLWDFGDGSTSTAVNPVRTYTDEGLYTVKLRVSDGSNTHLGIRKDYIDVLNPNKVYADFTADADSGKVPFEVQFTDHTLGSANAWHWDFGDGDSSALQNPGHVFYKPGKNTIVLVVSNGSHADTIQKEVYADITWKFRTQGDIMSSPAIGSDGTLYFGSEDSCLYALEENGALKWKFKSGNAIVSSPSIGEKGTIYIGSMDGNFYALNPDGTMKWKYEAENGIYSSPALGRDSTIYFGDMVKYFYALHPDGTLKWKIETSGIIRSSPSIGYDGTIYVGCQYDLYAIRPNGAVKWKFNTGYYLYSSPAIDQNGVLYICPRNYIYAINPDGSEKWKYSTDYWANKTSAAIGSDGTIYVGSENSNLYALHNDGTLKWKYSTGLLRISAPAVSNEDVLYIGDGWGYINAINTDGTLCWRFRAGYNDIVSSPVIGENGMVYVGSTDNYLYAVATKSTGLADSEWPCFRHNGFHTGSLDTTDGTNMFLSLSEDTIAFDANYNIISSFIITSNTDWTVSGGQDWLIVVPAGGYGTDTITVYAYQNTVSSSRTALLSVSGSYTEPQFITVTQEGIPTGLKTLSVSDVNVFPNPANKILYINGLIQNSDVAVYDMLGNLIIHERISGNQVDISNLSQGLYLIKLETQTGMAYKRFIKD